MPAPTPNVKIYDRPESKTPKPMILVVVLLVVAILGFFLYKAFYHPAAAPSGNRPASLIRMTAVHTDFLPRFSAPLFPHSFVS